MHTASKFFTHTTKKWSRIAALLLPLLALAACGSASRDAPPGPGPGFGPGTGYPVAADTARALAAGEPAPAMTEGAIRAAMLDRTDPNRAQGAADILLATQTIVDGGADLATNCPGSRGARECDIIGVAAAAAAPFASALAPFSLSLNSSRPLLGNYPGFGFSAQTVMVKNGATLFQSIARGTRAGVTENYITYGGWLPGNDPDPENPNTGPTIIAGSVFGFRAMRLQNDVRRGDAPQTVVLGTGFSAGRDSESNPRGIGSATWRGVMVGGMRNGSDFIQGDATIEIDDIRAANVDVAFTGIKNLNSGADIADMEWSNVALANGKFERTDNGRKTLEGNFYGPFHEEVGGVFDRGAYVGGFGAIRLATSGPADPNNPDYPVSADFARATANGEAVEGNLTASQINAAFRQRADTARADVLLTAGDNLAWRLDAPAPLGDLAGYAFNAEPVMVRNAITLAQSVSSGRPPSGTTDNHLNYFGWLDESAFRFGAVRSYTTTNSTTLSAAASFGDASGNRPTGLGSATWLGVMVGGTANSANIVQGNATLALNLDTARLSLAFTDIRNLNSGDNIAAMRWDNVALTGSGRFSHPTGALDGTFYGAHYAEVGGTFARSAITGAFGARRQTLPTAATFFPVVNADHAIAIAEGQRSATLANTIAATFATRARDADTLLLGGVIQETAADQGAPLPIATTCAGRRCEVAGGNLEISLDDLLLGNFRNYAFDTQAVMRRNGIDTFQTASVGTTLSRPETRHVYGAWLDESLFAIRITRYGERGATNSATERMGLTFGEASDGNPGGGGRAIWNGLMLGSELGTDAVIQGDATIDIDDLAAPDVDVRFENIVNLNAPATQPPYNTNGIPLVVSWSNIPLANGKFAQVNEDETVRITGGFYGRDHDEVGGAFNYNAGALNLVGAFGGNRGTTETSTDFPVRAFTARAIAGGAPPPALSASEIHAAFGNRTAAADTLLASDIGAPATSDCTAGACRITAGSRALTLADPFLGNYAGYEFSAQPVMTKNAVTLAQSVSRGNNPAGAEESQIAYAGWLETSAFGIRRVDGDRLATAGLATGNNSESNPAGTGAAVWEGVMVAGTANNLHVVQGDAALTLNLDTARLSLAFTGIRNLNTGDAVTDLTWSNLAVSNGAFTANNLRGTFYGADYAEAGGVFERASLAGAFGARRLADDTNGALFPVINAAHARAVIGAAAPTVNAADIANRFSDRTTSATRLHASDVVSETAATGATSIYATSCTSALTCAATDQASGVRADFATTDRYFLGNAPDAGFNTQTVALQNDINTVQAAAVSETTGRIPESRLTYGAWLDYSAFAVRVTRFGEEGLRGSNAIQRVGLSFGRAAAGNPGGTGAAAWRGVMLASSVGGIGMVQGDAHIDIDDLDNPNVDVAFRNIFDLNGPAGVPPHNVGGVPLTISWDDLRLTGGTFARLDRDDSDNAVRIRIRGGFYGTVSGETSQTHAEVGGTFNYRTSHFHLVGAFGGRRVTVDDPSNPAGTDYPVHAGSARAIAGGDAPPPELDATGINAAFAQRAAAADTLLASNIAAQLTTDCSSGATCRLVANTRALSLSDPFLGNFTDYSFSAQPVMVKGAVTIAQAVSRGANATTDTSESHISYAGWLENSAFGIRRTRLDSADITAGLSIGDSSESTPAGAAAAVWSGVMVGSLGSNSNVAQGDATLTLDLASANVDIAFTGIRNLNTAANVASLTWNDLGVTAGAFASATGDLRGSFYGADYAEVGGVFERAGIVGAFGAKRLEDGLDGALYPVVNAAHARAVISTAAASLANIATNFTNTAAAADTLLTSDVVSETTASAPATVAVTCVGRACEASRSESLAEFDLDQTRGEILGDLSGYAFNTQAVMTQNGVDSFQAASFGERRNRPETRLTYGAWLDHSGFAARILRYGTQGLRGSNAIERAAVSFGTASGGRPGGVGAATWTGVMLGSVVGGIGMVQGDAHIDIDDLGNPDVDIAFRNIFDLNGPAGVPPHNVNGVPLTISWDSLPIAADGTFRERRTDDNDASVDIRIRGNFYGSDIGTETHAEVGGTFNYRTSNFQFVGAFGGKRGVVGPDSSNTDFPVFAPTARALTGGNVPPRLGASGVAAAFTQRASGADTLLASNIGSPPTTDCSSATCRLITGARALSLAEPFLSDYPGYEFSAEPVMVKGAVTVAQAVSRGTGPGGAENHISYGGWVSESIFGIRRTRLGNATATAGLSIGAASATNPGGTGAAVWEGVMVGAQGNEGNIVQGDATLTLRLDTAAADLAFTDIRNLNTGGAIASLTWNALTVANGAFTASDLRGGFYGTDYSEVGGVFERAGLVGAFGGRRLADAPSGALFPVINASHARAVLSADPTAVSANIIASTFDDRAQAASRLLASDVVSETVSTGAVTTYAAQCAGLGCSAADPLAGFRAEFTLDDNLLGNIAGYDFNTQPVLQHNAIDTVQAVSIGTPRSTIPETRLTYGAWMEESAFAIRITRFGEEGTRGSNAIQYAGLSFGERSADNPGGGGSASWTGIMLGSAVASIDIVQGDAYIDVDNLANPDVDVAFGNIFNLNGPAGMPPYNVGGVPLAVSWDNLPVADGAFTDEGLDSEIDGIRIRGSFYGDDHDEVGGTFNYNTGAFNLVGAFGGKRGTAGPGDASGTNYPVFAVLARILTGGEAAPRLGATAIGNALALRASNADAIRATDFAADGGGSLATTCAAGVCTATGSLGGQNATRALALTDPLLGNRAGYSLSAQAVMVKNAVTLMQAVARGTNAQNESEIHVTYGGWLNETAFGVRRVTTTPQGSQTSTTLRNGWSIGRSSGSNPGGTGTLTWSGVMVGGAKSAAHIVQGDATLTLDLTAATADIAFTNIRNLNTAAVVADITWSAVAVAGGAFTSNTNELDGSFYGTTYEEVGGVFETSDLTGAFGAKRLARETTGTLFPIVNTANARALAVGTAPTAPLADAAAIYAQAAARQAAADSLLASDVAATDTSGRNSAHETSCAGGECISRSADFRVAYDLADLLLGNFSGYDHNAAEVMSRNAITTLQSVSVGVSQSRIPRIHLTYGGWLENGMFAVHVIRHRQASAQEDAIERAGLSFGLASASNPGGLGAAAWNGLMVGVTKTNAVMLQGDARIEIDDLANPDVDVRFTDLFDLNGPAGSPAYTIDGVPLAISWENIPLADGAFSQFPPPDAEQIFITIKGGFYGTDYAEVGGIFDYETADIGIAGAFGAKRVTADALDFPVNHAYARALTGGIAAPSLTASQTEAAASARAVSADTLSVSNIVPDTGNALVPTCSGRRCSASGLVSGQALVLDFNLDDFDKGASIFRRAGYEFNAQPVATRNNITLAQGVSTGALSTGETDTRLVYAGWLEQSAFGVQIVNLAAGDNSFALRAGFSFGDASGSNPPGTGGAEWKGVMVGTPTNAPGNRHFVQGDATIDIDDFTNPNVDVEFASVTNLNTGASSADMNWNDLPIANGVFTAPGGALRGTFYGSEHEEVGGTFHSNNIIGAFGGYRVDVFATPTTYPVNAETARTRAGGDAPTLQHSQVDAAARASITDANRMLASDLDIAGGASLATNCAGRDCSASGTVSTRNVDIALSADHPSLAALPGAVYHPQAVMERNGVTFAQSINRVATADGFEIHTTYGGWLETSMFAAQTIRLQTSAGGQADIVLRAGVSIGADNGGNPSGLGQATWNGGMVGSDKTSGNTIQGDATLTLDMNASQLDVAFTAIRNLNTGAAAANMTWNDLPLANGGFASSVGALEGSFYGSRYQEVGGTFDRSNIIGAFGGKRAPRGVDANGAPIGAFHPVLSLANAIAVSGSAAIAAPPTPGAIRSTFDSRRNSADLFLMSNVSATSSAGVHDTHITECLDETCAATNPNFQDFRLELSTSDNLLGNKTGYAFVAQPALSKGSIDTFQTIATGESAADIPETYLTYGAWLDDSAFAVQIIRYQQADPTQPDAIERIGMSFGDNTAGKPSGTGSAAWEGMMVGSARNGIDVVQGDARVDIDDLGADVPLVDVVFSNIFNLNGAPGGAPYNVDGEPLTISWDDIPMSHDVDNTGAPTNIDGTFSTDPLDSESISYSSDYGSLEGSFYGANHDEVGGVFNHIPSGITGAFGAEKTP